MPKRLDWTGKWEALVALKACGVSREKVAEYYGVSAPAVYRAYRYIGKLEGLPVPPDPAVIIDGHPLKPWFRMSTLEELVDKALMNQQSPDEYLKRKLENKR